MASDDLDLMRRIARKDQSALAALYHDYAGLVFGIAMRVLQNSVWAEEVMQDTFIKVWRDPQKWNPNGGRLVNWLVTVTRYTAIDRLRHERRQPPLTPSPLEDIPYLADGSTGIDDWLWSDQLHTLMDELPPPQRQVLQLAFWQGMTHVEISAHLRLPLGTVKSRLQLGLQKLRDKAHETTHAAKPSRS